jgi:hypothetical protein
MKLDKSFWKHMPTAFSCLFTEPTFKTVTLFLGNLSNVKQRVRITRHKQKIIPANSRAVHPNRFQEELHVTIGEPNYIEREFLAQCKRAKCRPRRFWFKSFPTKKGGVHARKP